MHYKKLYYTLRCRKYGNLWQSVTTAKLAYPEQVSLQPLSQTELCALHLPRRLQRNTLRYKCILAKRDQLDIKITLAKSYPIYAAHFRFQF